MLAGRISLMLHLIAALQVPTKAIRDDPLALLSRFPWTPRHNAPHVCHQKPSPCWCKATNSMRLPFLEEDCLRTLPPDSGAAVAIPFLGDWTRDENSRTSYYSLISQRSRRGEGGQREREREERENREITTTF